MKLFKSIFAVVLFTVIFFIPAMVFAEDTAVEKQVVTSDATTDSGVAETVQKRIVTLDVYRSFFSGFEWLKERKQFIDSIDGGCSQKSKSFIDMLNKMKKNYDLYASNYNANYEFFDWDPVLKQVGEENFPRPITSFYFSEDVSADSAQNE